MFDRTTLGRRALKGAMLLRRKLEIPQDAPICIYDFAEAHDVMVWFTGGPSFGGMYSKEKNAILVPALRNPPRQAFTAAHELGHWFFNHGTKADDLHTIDCETAGSEDEVLVNLFAGHLLMPIHCLKKEFSRRNITVQACTPIEIYRVASQLGVGYNTLLYQLYRTFEVINQDHFAALSKATPKSIRSEVMPKEIATDHLIYADAQWDNSIAIDLQVGDCAYVPCQLDKHDKNFRIHSHNQHGCLIQALNQGISIIDSENGWTNSLRVSRKEFSGRSIHRHFGDPYD